MFVHMYSCTCFHVDAHAHTHTHHAAINDLHSVLGILVSCNIGNIATDMFNRCCADHIHLSLYPTFIIADHCGLKTSQIILI